MGIQLDDVEVRVLGALMEKEVATPEYYPLSLNALVNACNQKSNREPVVSYDEDTVETALAGLRSKGLASRISGHDMRVPKHAHRLSELINLGRREAAVLCVLMLRGPQTTGELRGRTERLYQFDDLEAVEACLTRLMEWQPEPLVARLPRQVGYKEVRYAHLLSGEPPAVQPAAPVPQVREIRDDTVARLQATVDRLETEVAELKRQFADFRKQFE
ncbi:MAG TPA: YceH family protein [Bryobacteraceae bacterium]|nr:YceH family protein [Bryobacteraceae bacterium]